MLVLTLIDSASFEQSEAMVSSNSHFGFRSGYSRFDASLPHKCGVPRLAGSLHLCGSALKMRIAASWGVLEA